MFLEKNDHICFEFLNIDVTLLRIPLYFLQSSVDSGDFALRNEVFLLLHCTFYFFDSQGRFMHVGRTP